MKWFEQVGIGIVRYVSIFILLILTVFSMENTVFLYEISERCFFLEDNFIYNVIALLIVLVGVKMAQKYGVIIGKYVSKIKIEHLLTVSGVIMCAWIAVSQAVATADSWFIFRVADSLHANSTEFFEIGSYMYMCANQKGIVLLCYLLQIFAGGYNYLFFQLINVLAVLVIEWCIYHLILRWTKNVIFANSVVLVMILYLPIILYVSFTYGTLIGLALALLAILSTDKFFENWQMKYAIGASLFMALAVVLKSNYLIFLIAVLLVACVKIIAEKKIRGIMLPILMLLFFALMSMGVDKTLSVMTGGKSEESGMISSAYICMGFQESSRAPGWFNSYTYDVVRENHYDLEAASNEVRNDLEERISTFVSNPEYAYGFFSEKTISQWCEPTFESMFLILVRESNLEDTSIFRYWAVAPYSGANILIRNMLNYFQFIIYFGALWFCLTEKKLDISKWIGMITVIGGFLFHTMWEGKSQYILPYFMILIPYGCWGIKRCAGQIKRYSRTTIYTALVSKENLSDKITWILMILLVLLMLIFGISFTSQEDVIFYNNFLIYG